MSLNELAKIVETCTSCRLHEGRTKAVFGRGPVNAPLMIIGEAPGQHEDEQGQPFVGKSGDHLVEMLDAARIPRDRVYLANILKCFVAETRIEASGIERAFKRTYDGPLVEIVTGNRRLTGTPNHPILTDRGWVMMGALVEGDDLVCGTLRERVGLGDPDVENVPPRFDELFGSLAQSGVTKRVVGGVEDFHGDGLETEVEVVAQDRLLRYRGEPTGLEHLQQVTFDLRDHASGDLLPAGSRFSAKPESSRRSPLTAYRCISCRGKGLSRLRTGTRQSDYHGLRARAHFDSGQRDVPAESDFGSAEVARKSFESLASEVSLDRVIKVNRCRMLSTSRSAHVYNLQTTTGWYTANGVVVSNCRPHNNKFPEDECPSICMGYLRKQIDLIKPLLIVLMGKQAVNHLLFPATGLSADPFMPWVGRHLRRRDRFGDIRFAISYHPAYLLRNKSPQDEELCLATLSDAWMFVQARLDNASAPATALEDIATTPPPMWQSRSLWRGA